MKDTLLLQAVNLIKAGQRTEARELLRELLQEDRKNELAWLWYAECAESKIARIQILESCVRANPQANQAWLLLTELRRANSAVHPEENVAPTQPVKANRQRRDDPAREKPCIEEWKEEDGGKVFTVSPDCLSKEEFKRIEERASESLKRNPVVKITRREDDWWDFETGYAVPRRVRGWKNKEDNKVLFSVPNFGWYGR